ncbi:hypothetical protein F6B41_26030 [Microbacterium lushaniae]|nr:hypothetical protein F6B41_29590 [Microbacterium lushaniae]KAA9149393.1 hypothetical protein F6B41_26030 [Microbacterium lushaniae]
MSLPALLVLGGVLFWKGQRLRREAEAEKLDAAQQALDDMEHAFERARKWNEAQLAMIQRADLVGRTLHAQYVEPFVLAGANAAHAGKILDWDELPQPVQDALETELKLVSIVLDTRALPVWIDIATVGQPELSRLQERTAMKSEEWIDKSLTLAELDLNDCEARLRVRMAAESEL